MNLPLHFCGMPIYTNELCLKETKEPRRKHQEQRWHQRRSYHIRIQKKWNKRFGFVMEPVMYQTREALIVHPSLLPKIEAALKEAR